MMSSEPQQVMHRNDQAIPHVSIIYKYIHRMTLIFIQIFIENTVVMKMQSKYGIHGLSYESRQSSETLHYKPNSFHNGKTLVHEWTSFKILL